MADERQQSEWMHTSSLMAFISNMFRAKGKKAAKPEDFDPFASRRKSQKRKANRPTVPITVLRDVFCNKNNPIRPANLVPAKEGVHRKKE